MTAHRVALAARAVGLLLCLTTAVAAQTPDKAQLQAARTMMANTGAEKGLEVIVPNFLEESRRLIVETRPELEKPLMEVTLALVPEFNKRRDELYNQIATLYARRFTKAELDEINAFYSSPTGKKMVAVLPGAGVETRDFLSGWTRTLSTDIITRMRAEMKKKGYDM